MTNPVSVNLDSIMEFPKDGVFSKVIVKGEKSQHTLMCLSKGADLSEHTSTREASVTVLKGKGTFTLFDKQINMEPGVFIFMPRNAPHSLTADENLAILLSTAG